MDRAIDRILGQRYPGFIECVVAFDQSSPHRTAERRNGRALRIVENQREPGAAGARTSGAVAATGSLLAFCDDDDEWFEDKLRLQVVSMREHGSPAAVCGHVIAYANRRIPALPPSRIGLKQLLGSRTGTANFSTLVVDRNVMLDQVGLLDEAIPGNYGEDYDWMLRLAAVTPIIGVRQVLVRVNVLASSWFPSEWKTIVAARRYLLSKHPQFRKEARGLACLYGQIAFGLAAQGQSDDAYRWIRRTFASDWRQPRAYLAFLVAAGLVEPRSVERFARWLLGRRI